MDKEFYLEKSQFDVHNRRYTACLSQRMQEYIHKLKKAKRTENRPNRNKEWRKKRS